MKSIRDLWVFLFDRIKLLFRRGIVRVYSQAIVRIGWDPRPMLPCLSSLTTVVMLDELIFIIIIY
ncbi:MAG: hypothetical protein ACMUEM_06905 [Flavobacteriales bacterium AspAUS03]